MTLDEMMKKLAWELTTFTHVTEIGPSVDKLEPFENYIKRKVEEITQVAIEAEREACAKECEDYQAEMESEGSLRQGQIAKNCAAIIRDRSQSMTP